MPDNKHFRLVPDRSISSSMKMVLEHIARLRPLSPTERKRYVFDIDTRFETPPLSTLGIKISYRDYGGAETAVFVPYVESLDKSSIITYLVPVGRGRMLRPFTDFVDWLFNL